MRLFCFKIFLLILALPGTAAGGSAFAPAIDLHAHFRGALPADQLLKIALKRGEVKLPRGALKQAGIELPADEGGGSLHPTVAVSKANLSPDSLARLERAMTLSAEFPASFATLETAYDLRGPLSAFASDQEARYGDSLSQIAANYAKAGVHYAELSAPAEILDPAWGSAVSRALPEIEARTGVRLRFLLGIRRNSSPEALRKLRAEVSKVARENPYLIGVDFLGEEANATRDFSGAITDFARLKKVRPGFQVRVHAGENPRFPENVNDAIRAGATRIGHGVYGVTNQTLALALAHDVIVEINAGSNLALKNIKKLEDLPVRRYLKAGVRLTVGTDGSGVFSTSPIEEGARLEALGLREEDFAKIRASDARYEAEARRSQESFSAATPEPPRVGRSCEQRFGAIR